MERLRHTHPFVRELLPIPDYEFLLELRARRRHDVRMIPGCVCCVHHVLAAPGIQRDEDGGVNPIVEGQDGITVVIGRDRTYCIGDILKKPKRAEKTRPIIALMARKLI